MTVFRVQMTDGRIARIDAKDGPSALAYAKTVDGQAAAAKTATPAWAQGDPQAQRDYLTELAKQRARNVKARATDEGDNTGIPGFHDPTAGPLHALTSQPVLPFGDEIAGGVAAGGNAVANWVRQARGQPQVSSRAIYDADQDAANEYTAETKRLHPVASGVGGLLTALTAAPARGEALAADGVAAAAKGAMAKKAGLLADTAPAAVKAAPEAAAAAEAVPETAQAAEAAPKAVPKAPGRVKGLLQAAGTGGVYGAAYGAGEGKSFDERAENTKEGGETGALMGTFLHGVVAPALKAASPYVSDLVSGAKNLMNPADGAADLGPAVPTDQDAERAAIAAVKLAQSKGLTSDTVADRAAPYGDKPVTAAELIGPQGERQLGATARRAGATGDDVKASMRARALAAPERIKGDFTNDLGVDPSSAAGDIDAILKKGQADAAPLFEKALSSPEGVWNDELEGLAQRPAVKTAMASAATSAANAGRVGEGLTMGRVEVPPTIETAEPPDFNMPTRPAPRAPAKAPSRGPSLIKFLAQGGGVSGDGGELAAMDAPASLTADAPDPQAGLTLGPEASLAPPASTGDMGQMAMAAHDAGYFPEFPRDTPPGPDDLLGAIRDELAGKPRFAKAADQGAADRMAAAQAHDEQQYYGADPSHLPTEDAYGAQPAPETEPAMIEAPTAASWDAIRKRLNKLVVRDPQTNRPVMSGPVGIDNHDLMTAASDVGTALAGDDTRPGAISGYREPLDVSGDYLKVQSAFDRMSNTLTTGKMRDFGKAWASLKTPAEQNAGRAALASDVMTLWGRGGLKGGKFSVPGVQQKLMLAFGDSGASDFIQHMEAEAKLAASGARMSPDGGSPTMGLAEAASEQENPLSASAILKTGTQAAAGPHGLMSVLAKGADKVVSYGRTVGTTEGMRNEYGRILQMGPEEFSAFLDQWEKMPAAQRKSFPLPAGLLAGQMAGQSRAANTPP